MVRMAKENGGFSRGRSTSFCCKRVGINFMQFHTCKLEMLFPSRKTLFFFIFCFTIEHRSWKRILLDLDPRLVVPLHVRGSTPDIVWCGENLDASSGDMLVRISPQLLPYWLRGNRQGRVCEKYNGQDSQTRAKRVSRTKSPCNQP